MHGEGGQKEKALVGRASRRRADRRSDARSTDRCLARTLFRLASERATYWEQGEGGRESISVSGVGQGVGVVTIQADRLPASGLVFLSAPGMMETRQGPSLFMLGSPRPRPPEPGEAAPYRELTVCGVVGSFKLELVFRWDGGKVPRLDPMDRIHFQHTRTDQALGQSAGTNSRLKPLLRPLEGSPGRGRGGIIASTRCTRENRKHTSKQDVLSREFA